MGGELLPRLMSIKDASVYGVTRTIRAMGSLVDLASDMGNRYALRHAIAILDGMAGGQLSDRQMALLHYFRGNAFSSLRTLDRAGKPAAWDWHQVDFEKEIVSLRFASLAAEKAQLPTELRCRISTNLGNALSFVGRFVDAISCWDIALTLNPQFAMALGNKGYGLFYYGKHLYDRGHAALFMKKARDYMVAGISRGCDAGASKAFKQTVDTIDKILPKELIDRPFESEKFPMGKSRREREYRVWCLRHRLFLNPLNDLGPHPIAAQDVFSVPSIVVPITGGPLYHGFFNQMKQEFVAARFIYYDGVTADRPHFADRDVLLYDTLDYPCYTLAVEQQKLAFRSAYSILDKIAFFLNQYMGLAIPEKQVNFRSLWYDKQDKNRGLRPQFKSLDNWPLRGLFWLAKDIHEDSPGFRAALEPVASRLSDVRNHVEHKYLKVHDCPWSGPVAQDKRTALTDTLAYSIRRDELAERGMMMLRLVRAALIYLSLSIQVEERRRAGQRDPKKQVGVIPLLPWPDKWKR